MNTIPSRIFKRILLKTPIPPLNNIIRLKNYNECSLLRRFCQLAADENIQQPKLKYSTEDSEKILNVVNSKPSEELLRYNISKARLKKIETFKTKNGQFQSLDEILQLDSFGTNILQKFCDSILNEATQAKNVINLKRTKQFTTPGIPEAVRKKLNSCVALHVGVSSVSWARLELQTAPSVVTHWHHHDIIDKRLLLNDLVQRCLYIDYLIPEADCYVLEAPQVAVSAGPGNAEQININMQKAQLTAILSFALAKRGRILNNDENLVKNLKVFYLRRFLAARLYRTLIGTERVSTEQAVLDLMRTHFNIEDAHECDDNPENRLKHAASVSISMDLRNQYKLSEGYQREFLGQALLLGLTFNRLCLLKCPNSIGIVTGSS